MIVDDKTVTEKSERTGDCDNKLNINNDIIADKSVNKRGMSDNAAIRSGKPSEKSEAAKRRERQDFRRRYFDYYDDVKTNIKEDW